MWRLVAKVERPHGSLSLGAERRASPLLPDGREERPGAKEAQAKGPWCELWVGVEIVLFQPHCIGALHVYTAYTLDVAERTSCSSAGAQRVCPPCMNAHCTCAAHTAIHAATR